MFIDPDGARTFFVHGTSQNATFWHKNFAATKKWASLSGDSPQEMSYSNWSGKNFHSARVKGAYDLAAQIIEFHLANPDEPINLVGYSHGGNVAIGATNLVSNLGIEVNNLTIIHTPVRKEYVLQPGAAKNFVSLYNQNDGVQIGGGDIQLIPTHLGTYPTILPFFGEFGYSNTRLHPGAKNIDVTYRMVTPLTPVEAHKATPRSTTVQEGLRDEY